MTTPLQIALLQLKPRKGDYKENLQRLGQMLARIDGLEPRPQVVHLAETALTGYFVEGGVRELARTAGEFAADLSRTYRAVAGSKHTLDVVAGFYELHRGDIHNSAMYVTLGADEPVIHHLHRKMFLPTYGLFDEERFVERGHNVRAFNTPWGRAALLVCEDAWHSLSATLAALDGAEVIFLSAAAPARGLAPRAGGAGGEEPAMPASLDRWERLARDIADEHGVFLSVAHLVGTEGGKTFPGGSIVVGPKGDVRTRAPLWDEAITVATIDTADIVGARADMPLLSDLRTMVPHLVASLGRIQEGTPSVTDYNATERPARTEGEHSRTAQRAAQPFTLSVKAGRATPASPLAIDGALAAQWLENFVRDEVHRRGFTKAVVGLSGGVDSAVTAYLAVRALGKENVIGVCLPYRTSHADSLAHAQLVVAALGIESITIGISEAVDGYLAAVPEADPTRRGNVMSRVRMTAMFDLSARYLALPIGTSNKTERLLGYFTWHADDSPPINPLGDLFKTQVWQLAEYLGVPEAIVKKPATADLIEGQTDEGDLGISYAKADLILNALVSEKRREDVIALGFREHEVDLVQQRLEGTHWKRRPPTVAVTSASAIGESYLRPVDY